MELRAYEISEQPMQDTDGVGSANGIRTRVTAVRGRCPRPLDDSAAGLCVRTASFRTEQPAPLFSHGLLAGASNGLRAPCFRNDLAK